MTRRRSIGWAYTEKGSELVDCPRCKGNGEVYPVVPIGFGAPPPDGELCLWCMGAGAISRWWANQHYGSQRGK